MAEQEDEESEYAALMVAAEASRDQGAARRVVVVADAGADADATIPFDRVRSVHADPYADVPVEDDLAWYAADEIPDLV